MASSFLETLISCQTDPPTEHAILFSTISKSSTSLSISTTPGTRPITTGSTIWSSRIAKNSGGQSGLQGVEKLVGEVTKPELGLLSVTELITENSTKIATTNFQRDFHRPGGYSSASSSSSSSSITSGSGVSKLSRKPTAFSCSRRIIGEGSLGTGQRFHYQLYTFNLKYNTRSRKHRYLSNSADKGCLLYTSPSPRDQRGSRMPSSA